MASRIMHLLVAHRVAEELDLPDLPRMLVGSLVPDGWRDPEQRDRTHFKASRYRWSDSPVYQYGHFIVKYRERLADSFFIGYLTHLVADDVWRLALHFSGIQAQARSGSQAYIETLRHDYYVSNAQLLATQDLSDVRQALEAASWSDHPDEVDRDAIEEVRQDALNDFEYPPTNVDAPLALLTLDLIESAVERAAIRSIDVVYPLITRE